MSTDKPKDERFTPLKYLRAVRSVMGQIDLDPASTDFGNSRVKARKYFTKEEDALTKPWIGNIYLNPPYSPGNLLRFSDYFLLEFACKRIKQGIILTPNDNSTKWFKHLLTYLKMEKSLHCLVDHRIQFISPQGNIIDGSPDFGSVFHYYGEQKEKFAEVFAQFGPIMTRFEKRGD